MAVGVFVDPRLGGTTIALSSLPTLAIHLLYNNVDLKSTAGELAVQAGLI